MAWPGSGLPDQSTLEVVVERWLYMHMAKSKLNIPYHDVGLAMVIEIPNNKLNKIGINFSHVCA